MYLREIIIDNIRSIRHFPLTFDEGDFAGWHVLLGDNGAGKSTFVRAVALALAGPTEAAALRQDWSDWLRKDEERGYIRIDVKNDPEVDASTKGGRRPKNYYIPALLEFVRKEDNPDVVTLNAAKDFEPDPWRHVWGQGEGWFSASYGPFRRFSGGDKNYEKLFYSNPKLAPHLTAFGEDVALTEAIAWLQILYVQNLEAEHKHQKSTELNPLLCLWDFINKGRLLPHNTQLEEINSKGVYFRDGTNCLITVDQLSDGYRSVLSMTFELIRQMVHNYGSEKVFRRIRQGKMEIDLPGVVLIDEVDAHLHPPWQRRIGEWFCRYFPQVQFIVTTHSPLVCQAAVKGSVWRLPTPGEDDIGGRITGHDLQRLLYGNVLEAYSTEMFGADVQRSQAALEKLTRLAQLNRKQLDGKLNSQERKELQELRAIFPTEANADVEHKNGVPL